MADSQKFLCCSDIFRAAKVFTIAEIVLIIVSVIYVFMSGGENKETLSILLQLAYLAIEFYGIHKKNSCLILFGCVIRILETTLVVIGTIIGFCLFFGAATSSPASNLSDQEM